MNQIFLLILKNFYHNKIFKLTMGCGKSNGNKIFQNKKKSYKIYDKQLPVLAIEKNRFLED